jgi:hypothetical protein
MVPEQPTPILPPLACVLAGMHAPCGSTQQLACVSAAYWRLGSGGWTPVQKACEYYFVCFDCPIQRLLVPLLLRLG